MRRRTRLDLHLTILASWIALNAFWWRLTGGSGAIVTAWLLLTSYYACFHVASCLFSALARGRSDARRSVRTPPVAVLYLCMNDVRERAVASCVAQEYTDCEVFVLDDSTDDAERARVDALAAHLPVTVIRRATRDGFKAGNLNHALSHIARRFEHVAVIDADELIPPDFVAKTVMLMEGDAELAFVQAAHSLYGTSDYAKVTGDGIETHWNYFLPARNRSGFVYSYGHGVLFRRSALDAVGGFPEVVSEDLAVSAELRRAGYRGHYAAEVECREEAPPAYAAFRRRQHRIVAGTLEFLIRFAPRFLRSRDVPLVEKLDLLATLGVIYLPVPFIAFVLMSHALAMPRTPSLPMLAIVAATAFAPLCYLVPAAVRAPRRVAAYVARMTAIHLSLSLQAVRALFARRVTFSPTGDRTRHDRIGRSDWIDSLAGALIVVLGIVTVSPCVVAVGFSVALVPWLLRGRRASSPLLILPIVLTLAGFFLLPETGFGMAGVFAGAAIAYH